MPVSNQIFLSPMIESATFYYGRLSMIMRYRRTIRPWQFEGVSATQDPGNAMWQSSLAFQYVYIGDVLMAKSEYAGADENYRASLKIRNDLAELDQTNFTSLKNLADSHSKLSDAMDKEGDWPDALAERRAGLQLRQQIGARYPDSILRQRELINEYRAIAGLLQKQGQSNDARTQYQQALDVADAFLAKHEQTKAMQQLRQEIMQSIQELKTAAP